MSYVLRCLCVALPGMLLVGCEMAQAPVMREKSPRPITAIEVKQTSPRPKSQLTGSVTAWKTEQLGFQVAGRVETVLEPGQNIRGRTVDENKQVISDGVVIASLEKERYELAVAVAKAQRETAGAKSKAKESELKNIVPQQILAAQASVTVNQTEYARIGKLFERGAATQAELDRAKAALDTSQAELDGAKASEKVTGAELLSLVAQEKEAVENIAQAEKDLADTLLRSPFNGQIAEVHEIPGGYVQAGEPVVTMQMMDPISIDVAVSAETDSHVNYNDTVTVFLPDSSQPLEAMVYEKATIADAATRTFNVTLLVRNELLEVGLPEEDRNSNTPRVRMLVRLFTETRDRVPPYYVNVESIYKDGDGYFVWRVTNATQADRSGPSDSKLKLQKVRVTPGEKRLPYLQVATMRELTDIGDLDPEKDLIAGAFYTRKGIKIPSDKIAAGLKDGVEVPYVRERWLLRPGDIVQVDLSTASPPPGIYVPSNVILDEAGKTYVFAVETTGDTAKVKRVAVKVLDALGTSRRIEAITKGGLKPGMKIADDGALFLTDGDTVSVIERSAADQ